MNISSIKKKLGGFISVALTCRMNPKLPTSCYNCDINHIILEYLESWAVDLIQAEVIKNGLVIKSPKYSQGLTVSFHGWTIKFLAPKRLVLLLQKD